MKKTVLAALLLLKPRTTRLRQRRQVGPTWGRPCACQPYLRCRLSIAFPSHPQHVLFNGQAARYNNPVGTRVVTPSADANVSGTYADLPEHNNQCNYSVEGGILATRSASVAIAAQQPNAIDTRLTAQAVKHCPDSEQLSSVNDLTFCPGSPLPVNTSQSGSPCVTISGCQVTTCRWLRARAICTGFWIFPS